ncbi:ARD/ARD' family-domain-containing protein [Mycena sanguinolenta]|nr:ARD/ARD' family-domain-containing protein [Mycena sanguinolenta]
MNLKHQNRLEQRLEKNAQHSHAAPSDRGHQSLLPLPHFARARLSLTCPTLARYSKGRSARTARHARVLLPTDQRLPHITDPLQPVSAETLANLGVLSWHVPSMGPKLVSERAYKNRDVINVSREGAVYEEKIRGFFEEHMHEDEEIRYILSRSGFFYVRGTPSQTPTDIAVAPGDLLVLPAGIYHRFTLDTKSQIRALRFFKDEPKWIPHARSTRTDTNTHRVGYLRDLGAGIAAPSVGAVGA